MTRQHLLSGLLFTILLIVIIVTTRSEAISLFSPEDLTPTAVPPELLTQIAQESTDQAATETAFPPLATQTAQTEQAYQMTFVAAPTSDMQQEYPIFSNAPLTPEEILLGRPESTPAGYGILYEDPVSGVIHKYWPNEWVWQESTYDSVIWARGGYVLKSPTQGVIQLSIITNSYNSNVVIESPVQAGELTIIGAVGERLILTSEQGQNFYFDVPSLHFVDNLEEIVPSATPAPTLIPELPYTLTDDVLDEPLYLADFQLEDTDVNYYINSPTDYDWFAFVSQAEGRLKVSLVPHGNNYGLRVVLVDQDGNGAIVGEDTSSGGGAKQVTVDNTPSGNYIVRVWSLDGSFNESQPYTLRFEPPRPKKITPILECIAENPDGTFTAHFGYENPNSYVVVIDSRHQNTFYPAPTLRTGQPEYFAPGRVENFFVILFDGNGLTWTLDGGAVTANRNSPRCP